MNERRRPVKQCRRPTTSPILGKPIILGRLVQRNDDWWIQFSYAYFHTRRDDRPDSGEPAFFPASPTWLARSRQWGKCFRPLIKAVENRTRHQTISYRSTGAKRHPFSEFTGNKSHAAIIIREHYDRLLVEGQIETSLAGDIKIIHID